MDVGSTSLYINITKGDIRTVLLYVTSSHCIFIFSRIVFTIRVFVTERKAGHESMPLALLGVMISRSAPGPTPT